jgi:hypothetical protein
MDTSLAVLERGATYMGKISKTVKASMGKRGATSGRTCNRCGESAIIVKVLSKPQRMEWRHRDDIFAAINDACTREIKK